MKATLSTEAAEYLGRPPISITEPSRRHSLGVNPEDDEDTMPRKPKTEPAAEAAPEVKPKRKYTRRQPTLRQIARQAAEEGMAVSVTMEPAEIGSTTTKFAIDSDGNVVVETKIGVAMMSPRDVHALQNFLGQTRPIWDVNQGAA